MFFLRRPRLVALAVITALTSVFGRNYSLTLAVLVTGPLAAGAGAYGAVSTVLAVGGVAGALVAGRLRRPTVRLVGTMAAIGGLLQIAAGLSPSLLVLLVLVVPMAIVESVSDTAGTTVLQTDPPPAMRGRVLGVWRSLSTGWGLAGPPLLGLLMETAGARGALILGGVLIAGTVLGGTVLHDRRKAPASVPGEPAPTSLREVLPTVGTVAAPVESVPASPVPVPVPRTEAWAVRDGGAAPAAGAAHAAPCTAGLAAHSAVAARVAACRC
jgi:MFS family permease